MPSHIQFVEVGPRDGLQNEAVVLSTEVKLGLIARAILAGARRIEVTSFVGARRVPQMADAEAVAAGLPVRNDVTYIGLAMNRRGVDRAIATNRIDQIGAVCVSTDRFAIANQGQTSAESVTEAIGMILQAQSAGLTGQVTIAASFGCPFEGEVDEDHVVGMARQLAVVNPIEIGLADTIGVADPVHVSRLVGKVVAAVFPIPVRAHFHNTRGTGLANVWAAIGAGAKIIDAAVGGVGGCPFAPGAAGNVASEDVAYMLERAGVATGMDVALLGEASRWLEGKIGRTLPGMVAKAPSFPSVSKH